MQFDSESSSTDCSNQTIELYLLHAMAEDEDFLSVYKLIFFSLTTLVLIFDVVEYFNEFDYLWFDELIPPTSHTVCWADHMWFRQRIVSIDIRMIVSSD